MQNGRIAQFCDLVDEEVAPKACGYVARRFAGSLSFEDCEDCWNEGLEKAVAAVSRNSGAGPHTHPIRYLYEAAQSVANDMLRERHAERDGNARFKELIRPMRGRRKRSLDPESDSLQSGEWLELDAQAATILAEELADIEVSPSVAVQAVRWAVSRLSPVLRQVAEHILIYGPNHSSTDPPVGMEPATYRKNKERAFKKLRLLIPFAFAELGQVVREAEVDFEWPEHDESDDVTPQGLEE